MFTPHGEPCSGKLLLRIPKARAPLPQMAVFAERLPHAVAAVLPDARAVTLRALDHWTSDGGKAQLLDALNAQLAVLQAERLAAQAGESRPATVRLALRK